MSIGAQYRPLIGVRFWPHWLAELIGALGLAKPAVARHSYGGWIALGTAALRPDALGPVTPIAPASGLARFRWHMAPFLRVAEDLPWGPSAETILRFGRGKKGCAADAQWEDRSARAWAKETSRRLCSSHKWSPRESTLSRTVRRWASARSG